MTDNEAKPKSIYGENVPTEEADAEPGIREKTAESTEDKTGGAMDTVETPKDDAATEESNSPD